VLVLTAGEVAELLDLDALVDALDRAMADLSARRASSPDRVGTVVPEPDGRLLAMPGYVPSQGALARKLVAGSGLRPSSARTRLGDGCPRPA
jgi:ornithine cyclodeaminase/alanine dehydrogenase-like protein (mu-crystallin family)